MESKLSGYTLIEVMVALSVFAIIAAMSANVLFHAFDIRKRVAKRANQMDELQMVTSIIRHDTEQLFLRSIRSENMRLLPMFTGKYQYLEFTRGGMINPDAAVKESSLKRIAYLCRGDALIRRSWRALDAVHRNAHDDRVLLKNLQKCSFSYISIYHQTFNDWRAFSIEDGKKTEVIPTAIQLTIAPEGLGEMQLTFIIAAGLYG